uniref:C2H2-type domain-containing protein n=1 Tax=Meloidogyne enterolobii TaxID=390850 RepID=A0A6V7TNC5_MELEN|nr:unnamed protein product [Meloidogyne enterolobii]
MGGFKGLKNCSFCEYKNKLTSQVRRHERQAHGDKALECTINGCGARLPYNRLARHVREKHCLNNEMENPNSPTKQTEEIEKEKINDQNNEELIKTEEEEEQFTDISLFVNKKAASGEFTCPQCDKKFKTGRYLRKHFNQIHGDIKYKKSIKEKKYLCNWPLCDKSFISASKLEGHLNSHKGEKPYGCEHCGKNFSVKYELNRHLQKYHLLKLSQFTEKIEELLDNN